MIQLLLARRVWQPVLLALTVLSLGACKALTESGVVQKPSASLSDLSVRGLSAEGVQFDVVLKVNNPNPVALNLAGFDYDFQVSGQSLVSGKQDVVTQVAASGHSNVRLPLALKFSDLKEIGGSLANLDRIPFGLKATAFIEVPVLGSVALPVEKSGEVPVPKMPKVSVKSLKVDNMGLTGADLALTLSVDNPNTFGIDVSHFKSALKVDGVDWVNTMVSQPLNMAPKQSQQVVLPIRLDFLILGTQMMRRLQNSEPFQYELSGDFLLNTELPMLGRLKLPYQVKGEVPLR